ncbi:GTP cyclohydrolase II [Microcella alkaliphila]|uniref:GTP cyclohydrolase-2 n=1 Tax=Microcella alkaliphila TaxID=279828 RepID=A0A0U4X000_9MICO|nr:GTP cyclohydrolase II [Microcella alkaliphila]BAU33208.1 3,4-dihydroxy-2-butanone-4-phosphate synthase [Microcella alkaliphila]
MSIASIPQALAELRAGRPVLVADDESRENEGDVIISAELATPEWIAWTIRNTSGFLCAPMTNAIADRLELPLMVERNEDSLRTAYTVTVDAASGITTGISARDRAHTLRVLANAEATPASVIRPGHILPLRAVDGGVRQRPGHTEAAVELMRLAGLSEVAAIGELVSDDGDMMRLPEMIAFGRAEGVVVITIADLIDYLNSGATGDDVEDVTPIDEGSSVRFEVATTVPTNHGPFSMRAYRDRKTGADHVAIVSGMPRDDMVVRVHSECLTGEAFGSLKCECGPQLDAALDVIHRQGGAVLYMRGHEGRGIGLINKLKAYRLQEDGYDTLDANLALGLPADARDYQAASDMLRDLGVTKVRLLSNNPEKMRQLTQYGIEVTGLVPLVVGVGTDNEGYLNAKRDRMGHQLPDSITSAPVFTTLEGRTA